MYKKININFAFSPAIIKLCTGLILLFTAVASNNVAAHPLCNACLLYYTKKEMLVDSAVKTYLALGDSYTIGQSVDSAQRFPAQTAAILKHKGIYIPVIDYIATTGWKTVNLQWAIEAQRTKPVYDMVTLLIGVNDQYQNHDTIGYRAHFINLVQKAIAYAGNRQNHVFILSIPDYSVTPFGRSRDASAKGIDEFNTINKNVALSYGISYTDITGISRYDAIDPLMLAYDDMHPSGRQYEQWAQALAEKVVRVIKE